MKLEELLEIYCDPERLEEERLKRRERLEADRLLSINRRKDFPDLQPGDNLYSNFFGRYIGKFRRGPIGGLYRFGRRYGGCMRTRIKTTQERRMNCAHKEYVRIRGRRINVPTAWDDISRSDQGRSVSWKSRSKSRCQWGGDRIKISEKIIY